MARVLYLNGDTELKPFGMDNREFASRFPGVVGLRFDSYARLVGRAPDGSVLPVERRVEYKAQPSRHACDARCLNATGKTMRCECACGGRNHGRGTGVFQCA